MAYQDQSKRTTRSAAELVTAAVTLAAGTQAYGDVVRFDNPAEGDPGHFAWTFSADETALSWLDITRPSTDQDGLVSPMSVGQLYGAGFAPDNFTEGGASVLHLLEFDFLTTSVVAGTIIDEYLPPGDGDARTAWSNDTPYNAYHSYYYLFVGASTDINSGEYLAVRFEAADGMHYGWIGVTTTYVDYVYELSAFAWGYETDPMTPIAAGAVPAPGTLAALAFGAVALGRRKRKEE